VSSKDQQSPKGKRLADTMRNLDDSLKIFNFITLKSAGVVLVFFGGTWLLDMLTGCWDLIFGMGWGFMAHKLATAFIALCLHWVEKQEDEFYVPSAIVHYATRPWRYIYSGAYDTYQKRRAWWDVLSPEAHTRTLEDHINVVRT
jgi:hypothetical protein